MIAGSLACDGCADSFSATTTDWIEVGREMESMQKTEIIRLEIPNPFFEGRNQVYLLPSDPFTVIDTGVATQKAFDTVVAGFEQHGLLLTNVKRVLLTHKHIDHIGNAWRIQQASGCEILISEQELHSVQKVDPEGERFKELVRERLTGWDVPEDAMPTSSEAAGWKWEIEAATASGLADGDRLPQGDGELEVFQTPGHTMGSICVRYGNALFSGDHVLPKISPNVGGGDLRRQGMLRYYLDSLERIAQLDHEELTVYPGHGEPFETLRNRCEQLIRHHHHRLEQLTTICRKEDPQTVYQLALRLFGTMNDFHVVLGCAEAAAHLEYLEEEGVVTEREGRYRIA
jgi:glyoxylase-like metal-dependent hydrolase (beta-lactamase superfamily II)